VRSPAINWGDPRMHDVFWQSVIPEPMGGCWLWTGPVNHDYGKTTLHQRHTSSHRKAWLVLVGEIPDGVQLDHLCKNTRCCNPAHLEVVTPRENQIRSDSFAGVNARKTHCVRGHELTGDNLFFNKGGKERQCRTCHNARGAANKKRTRARQRRERIASLNAKAGEL
jgi:hypothetical protein